MVKTALARVAYALEKPIDRLRFRFKKRLGRIGPITIIPYRGYGDEGRALLRGRVLENRMLSKPDREDSVWRNLSTMIRRFTSEEIAGARVRIRYGGTETEALSDDEGYFQAELRFRDPQADGEVWQEARLELADGGVAGQGPVSVSGAVMTPGGRARFGVISDVDDTVLVSHVTTFLARLEVFFLRNAYTRKPFEGVAAFYRALQRGAGGQEYNPIFYVSSSPWNIYDLFEDFFRANGIPAGPFFLQDYGLEKDRLFALTLREHKRRSIEAILGFYDRLPFILIGDSGQKDAEIYARAAREFPGRVTAIYIRDVTPRRPHRALNELARDLQGEGVDLLLVKDTLEAARHAVRRGFLTPQALESIGAQREVDRSLPSPLKQFLDGVPRKKQE